VAKTDARRIVHNAALLFYRRHSADTPVEGKVAVPVVPEDGVANGGQVAAYLVNNLTEK
jgi:membrane-bound lytic murein transglycosylase